MRVAPVFAGLTLLAASLSACSEQTQEKAKEAGNAIANDMSNAAADVSNAAEKLTDKAQNALDKANADAANASNATGAALENAGHDLREH